MKKLLFIFGTRPEAVKMAPLIKEFNKHRGEFNVKVLVTAQHRQMLDQVLDFFEIKPDWDLNLMKPNQTLFDITADGLRGIEKVLAEYNADVIFVQGDTTTVLIGALAAFYKKIKVAHIEAGLRSGNKFSPYPEEMNRTIAGHIADFHFAPTEKARESLAKENIKRNVYVVGNTVIDALHLGLDIVKKKNDGEFKKLFNFIDFSKKIILVTGHRRESFGAPFEDMCGALKEISLRFADEIEIIYPAHLNPHVQAPVKNILSNLKNVHLIEPLDYPKLIWLMEKSYIVLTDSGGIQEEAPALGKPVLVMRDVTERQEGIDAGTAKLVGTSFSKIVAETQNLISNEKEYEKMAHAVNPYGDGTSSRQIVEILKKHIHIEQ